VFFLLVLLQSAKRAGLQARRSRPAGAQPFLPGAGAHEKAA